RHCQHYQNYLSSPLGAVAKIRSVHEVVGWLSTDEKDNSTKLGLFAIYCWCYGWHTKQRGNQYGTIQLKLPSIRWYHKTYAGTKIKHSPDFDVLMRGIQRLSDPLLKRHQITQAFYRLLSRRLDFTRPRSRLLWGAVLLAYFFLLRRSEYLLVESGRHAFYLKVSNAYFSSREGERVPYKKAVAVTIGLAGAKNDQFGRGAWRTMHATGDKVFCSTKALHHLQQARKELGCSSAKYLCVNLTGEEVTWTFKTLALNVGVSPDKYATHSVRIGGASALLSGEADSLEINLLGRWMSHSYEDYPVLAPDSARGLSRRMI
ncbi:hypothetical protein PPTG_19900, partial [Phytophthora nicotianae INRA-310]